MTETTQALTTALEAFIEWATDPRLLAAVHTGISGPDDLVRAAERAIDAAEENAR